MARKRKRSCKYGKLKSKRGRRRCKKPAAVRAHRKSAKRVAAGRKAARTRKRRAGRGAPTHDMHSAWEAPKRKRSKKRGKKRSRASYKRKRPGHRKHSVRGYYRKKSRGSRKRVYVKGHRSHEAPKRRRRRRHHAAAKRHSRRHYHRRSRAMENPISVMDGVVGGVCGLIGYGAAEVVDRLLATHALTDTNTKDANGVELYTDPADSSGHWNATYVLGPMSLGRWAAGLGIAIVPLLAGGMIKKPALRSCVQFFGFGALIRTGGKGLTDLLAYVSRKTAVGQRLFIPEDSAQSALSAGKYDTTLPGIAPGPTGLAGLPPAGCGCVNCKTGVGACCGKTTIAQLQQGTIQRATGQPQTGSVANPTINDGQTVGTPAQQPPGGANQGGTPVGVANPPSPSPVGVVFGGGGIVPSTSPGPLRGAPLGSGAGRSPAMPVLYNPNIRRMAEGN
jgi:hypothetical protein